MRKVVTVLVAASLAMSLPALPLASAQSSRRGDSTLSDPALLAAIEEAREARRTQGGPERSLTVELLTADAASARAAVAAAGGTVTGEVPGELVQARVPVGRIDGLTATPGVRYVKAPRRAGYLTPPDRPVRLDAGTGVEGAAVAITNADDWQTAGFSGAGIKVGIVDFFDLGLWATLTGEAGPVPDAAHQFCQDSIVPPPSASSYCNANGTINSANGDEHGVAVAEIVKDMAPGVELFIATVATTADLQAAVNWFASNGVTIVTRSLGAAFDGPGDGTGPLSAVVNSAVAQGITWFNSAGNDGQDAYMKFTVPTSLGANGYVDFDEGPGTDTYLRIDGYCVLMDGVRWANDWYLPTNQRTDYRLEFFEPNVDVSANGDHYNPTAGQLTALDLNPDTPAIENVWDASQIGGANPLEGEDLFFCPDNTYGPEFGISYMRIRRNAGTVVGGSGDTMEIGVAVGLLEIDYSDTAGSAAKPVVDSKNPGLVAVGAVDPPAGSVIAPYSSQGPTTDGRIKPDVSAPAGFFSEAYDDTFSGTSAASPVAAGMAALLQGGGLAAKGMPTAALVKQFVQDLGTPGMDNAFGLGKVLLPAPPGAAPATTNAEYMPLALPTRVLDTRPAFQTGPPALVGPYAPETIINLPVLNTGGVPASGVSAVAINLTSVNTTQTGYLQAYPYLRATVGGTSTLNISTAGPARPNFAIVPVGVNGTISIYLQAGGNVIVDVMGYFADGVTTSTNGRFVPLANPERWMDTRGLSGAPLPAAFSGTPRLANAGETITVPVFDTSVVPATGVAALVVNVTAANSAGTGYLQANPAGATGAVHSTVNYTSASASANTAIVPLGTNGEIQVFTNGAVNIIVDVVGYITDGTAADTTTGLFRAITPGRAYDTRVPSPTPFAANEVRVVQLTGLVAPVVPAGAAGVSANLTVVNPGTNGFLKAYPNAEPSTSSLNFAAGKTVANGALLGLSGTGTVSLKMSGPGNVIVDINGYFLA